MTPILEKIADFFEMLFHWMTEEMIRLMGLTID